MIRRTAPLPPLLAAALVALGAWGALSAGASPVPASRVAAAGGSTAARLAAARHRSHRRRPRPPGGLILGLVSAAPAVSCPGADVVPGPRDLAAAANATLCLVNQARARHGVGRLAANAKLERSARQHNDDMIAAGYFDLAGSRPGDNLRSRVLGAGYLAGRPSAYSLGENIAFGTLDRATPRQTVDGWASEPAYLGNILDPGFTDAGIAVAAAVPAAVSLGLPGATYTLDFGSP